MRQSPADTDQPPPDPLLYDLDDVQIVADHQRRLSALAHRHRIAKQFVTAAEQRPGSFGATWNAWGQAALTDASQAQDFFVYRSGDRISGAMKVVDHADSLFISQFESLGGRSSVSLIQTAIRESIARGFGVQLSGEPVAKALDFWKHVGFDAMANGEYVLTAEKAAEFLKNYR